METDNQIRLRRAKEALESCRTRQAEAVKALADAVESTKRAREKYEELFLAEEKAEVARLRNTYNHSTK